MRIVYEGTEPVYLESTLPGARVVMSTRHGGVSEGPFATSNLSLSVGDDPERVAENRRRLFSIARLGPAARVRQVHGSEIIAVASPGDAGAGDGLVTAESALPLVCLVADCAPVVASDARAGLVGIAHAGWRGAAAGVVPAMISALLERGARGETLSAAVLPCIGPCCFEVGEEVAERFPSTHRRAVPGARPHLDLHGAIREQLVLAGVPAGRIEVWDLCTRCRADLFFSYRRDGRASGRMLASIVREA